MAKLLPSLTLRGLADYVGVAIGLIVAMSLLASPAQSLEDALRRNGGA